MQLKTYYCLCGEFILVVDKPLHLLPKRRTDQSTIITHKPIHKDLNSNKRNFKINALPQIPILLQRQNGMCERQHRLSCPRCTIVVAYTFTAPLFLSKQDIRLGVEEAEYVYILKGALSEVQGLTPTDALEGFDNEQNVKVEPV